MLKLDLHNWWLLVGMREGKDSALFNGQVLRVWPCSSEDAHNRNYTCFFLFFSSLFCFLNFNLFWAMSYMGGALTWKDWEMNLLGYMMWNSKRIKKNICINPPSTIKANQLTASFLPAHTFSYHYSGSSYKAAAYLSFKLASPSIPSWQ